MRPEREWEVNPHLCRGMYVKAFEISKNVYTVLIILKILIYLLISKLGFEVD